LGCQGRGALYRAAQAILGRRAPDGRPAGNLGWTGAGWLLCGGEETGERARAVSESSGRWQVGRRGSADARAEGGGRLVRGAARTWALASGVTRGRADVWAQAVSRGGERVRCGSRPGAGCWRGRAGPRLGRDLGRGVASWDGFGGLGFFFNLFYFYSKINKV